MLLEGGTNPTISFDTDSYLASYGSKTSSIQIPCELPTNCIISAKIKVNAVNFGLGVGKSEGYGDGFVLGNNVLATYRYSNNAWQSSFYSTTNVSYVQSNYNELTIEKTGQSVTIKLNGNTITTKTLQFSNSDTLYPLIIMSGNTGRGNIKEITIKPL